MYYTKTLFTSMLLLWAGLMISCKQAPTEEKSEEIKTENTAIKADKTTLKAEIQNLESAWSAASNSGDAATIIGMYSDDAVSMVNNKPMASGKTEIGKEVEEGIAKKKKGTTVSYEVMDVYGDENEVTEFGKTTVKDGNGKITYTGKYAAVWQKKDGKYRCVREIYNDDAKEK